jgi:hypothetical protein
MKEGNTTGDQKNRKNKANFIIKHYKIKAYGDWMYR